METFSTKTLYKDLNKKQNLNQNPLHVKEETIKFT